MAATVEVRQTVGAGAGSAALITNLRHNTDDTVNPGTTNPLVKPTAGTNWGFWKTVHLEVTIAPSGTIDNGRFFSDGTIGWTGVVLNAIDASTGANSGYRQGVGTVGTTGTELTLVNHTGLDAAPASVATYTSASPLALAGSIVGPSIGKVFDYVVLQAAVSTSAVAGTLAAETLTFRYDET